MILMIFGGGGNQGGSVPVPVAGAGTNVAGQVLCAGTCLVVIIPLTI